MRQPDPLHGGDRHCPSGLMQPYLLLCIFRRGDKAWGKVIREGGGAVVLVFLWDRPAGRRQRRVWGGSGRGHARRRGEGRGIADAALPAWDRVAYAQRMRHQPAVFETLPAPDAPCGAGSAAEAREGVGQ